MNKEFLKKCWKHPRWHSLMVLIIWIVSLTLLMGIVTIVNQFSSPKDATKKEIPKTNEVSYEVKWNRFSKEDYSFKYIVSTSEGTVKYKGTVTDEITTGYRERADGIIRYSIEDGIVYEILMEEKKEWNSLYENIDSDFVNLSYLEDFIQNIPASASDIVEEDKKTTYEYTVIEENLKIVVITDEVQIESITIIKGNETYELSFAF